MKLKKNNICSYRLVNKMKTFKIILISLLLTNQSLAEEYSIVCKINGVYASTVNVIYFDSAGKAIEAKSLLTEKKCLIIV